VFARLLAYGGFPVTRQTVYIQRVLIPVVFFCLLTDVERSLFCALGFFVLRVIGVWCREPSMVLSDGVVIGNTVGSLKFVWICW